MNGLMLHCGAHEVARDAVFEVKTPEPSHRGEKGVHKHYPIPHTLLLEEVEKNLEDNGFEITQQAHALTQEGQRYFGLLEVRQKSPEVISSGPIQSPVHAMLNDQQGHMAHLDDPSVRPDYGLVIGLRNAHDGVYSAALCMGNRVFVCDNLSFSGEVLIGRKHTRHIARDIPRMIPRAFAALTVERVNMETRIEAYKDATITDEAAHDYIIRSLVDEKIFPPSSLPKIVQEWRKPRHKEFEARTVWSLVNSFTEVAKPTVKVDPETGEETRRGISLPLLMGRTNNLYGFFDKNLGVSLKSREELDAKRNEILTDAAQGEDVLVGYEAARVHRNN